MNPQALAIPLRSVKLYGELGRRFGREHRLAVSSPAEAVRALCVLVKGFQAYLANAKDRGIAFGIFIGRRNIDDKEELRWQSRDGDIRVVPMIMGASGVVRLFVGVVLIVVGVLTGMGPLVQLGISLALSGIAAILAPHPKKQGANQANYAFDGPVNTQAQGNPVPVLLGGPLIIGSATISAGITVDNDVVLPTTGAAGGGAGGAGGSAGSGGGGGGGGRIEFS